MTTSTPTTSFLELWQRCKLSWQWVLYLTASLLGICLFVFINATQALVLTQIVGIPSEELGDRAGTLAFTDQIASMFAVLVFGVLSDRVGRRLVYSFGFLAMGAALCAYPHLKSYEAMLGARLLFAFGGGAASSMVTAVLADYAEDRIRGRMAGLVGLCSGCGALVALFVFMPLPLKFQDIVEGIQITYLIVGLLSVIFSVLLFFFLTAQSHPSETPLSAASDQDLLAENGVSGSSQSPHDFAIADQDAARCPVMQQGAQRQEEPGRQQHEDEGDGEDEETQKTLFQMGKEGFLAARDPKVLLGYVGSFLARGDTVIITLFIPLWVYKRYIEAGLCVAPGGINDPDIKDDCRAAYSRASVISGIAQTAALVGAPVFGYLADRIEAKNVVLLNAFVGLVAYSLMFVADPMLGYVFAVVIFVGLSEIGLVIGNMSLVTDSKSVDKSIRGSVAGVSSMCGAVGILISSKLGGLLFDQWREGAPFLILAVGHLIAVVVGVFVVFFCHKQRILASSNIA
ncbi:major facilitator superfamily domain-containing protein [Obelidium mucronatum]|nr:major facilitator superfamily domain-containing protein [Obelidium mucronatum]